MNYKSPAAVLPAATIVPVFDAIAVAMRLYTRRAQRLPLLMDDGFTIPALVNAAINSSSV